MERAGQREGARESVGPLYSWFTEGFDAVRSACLDRALAVAAGMSGFVRFLAVVSLTLPASLGPKLGPKCELASQGHRKGSQEGLARRHRAC
jgi:hypothetical protein